MQASRYKIQELIDTQGAVSTYQALDTLSNEPVLYYQYLAEPIDNAVQILSDNIPDILNMHYTSGMTHVVTVFPQKKQRLKTRLEDSQLEQFLLDTSQALEDASDAGVIHGDIRPERLLYDGSKFLIEGYGVRWELLPSRYSAPEKHQTVAGDVYSWAKTVGAFVPFTVPKTIAALLKSCLVKDPKDRPLPEDIVDELSTFFLEASQDSKHPTVLNLKQTIADAQPDLLDNLFSNDSSDILTHTQERFINPESIDLENTGLESRTSKSQNSVSHHHEARKHENSIADTHRVDARVVVEGTDDSGKLSTADLASNNLNAVSELSDSRADISGNATESLPEVSSSARITDVAVTNQSISNQAAINNNNTLGTTKATAHKNALSTKENPNSNLDTIDQSLAIIANADTVSNAETPFLPEDDFSDLATQIEADEVSVQKDTIEKGNKSVISLASEEVVIADNFATQERMIDVAEAEILGLDAIEHKPSFDDLTSTQVEIIELYTNSTSVEKTDINDTKDLSKPNVTEFDLADVEDDVLDILLEDLPENKNSAEHANGDLQAEDIEVQAIEDIFAEKPDPLATGERIDVTSFDFSDTGFETDKSREAEQAEMSKELKSKEPANNDFDATAFDLTAFDATATAYGTTLEQIVTEDIADKAQNLSDKQKTKTIQAAALEDNPEEKNEFDSLVADLIADTEHDASKHDTSKHDTNKQAETLKAIETKEEKDPTYFPVNELDFDAFAKGKSSAEGHEDFESEEEEHLQALQNALKNTKHTQSGSLADTTSESSVSEVLKAEKSLDEVSIDEVSIGEASIDTVLIDEVSIDEVSFEEVSFEEVSIDDLSFDEISLEKSAVSEISEEDDAVEAVNSAKNKEESGTVDSETLDSEVVDSINPNELMPHSTQLERAFAALSTTIHDASTFGTSEENEVLDFTSFAESALEEETAKTENIEPKNIEPKNIEPKNIEPDIADAKTEVSTKSDPEASDFDIDTNVENANQEAVVDDQDISLVNTDFSELTHGLDDLDSLDDSGDLLVNPEDTQEVLMAFDNEAENDILELDSNSTPDTSSTVEVAADPIEVPNLQKDNAVKDNAVKEDESSNPEIPSFEAFLDDTDEAAHLYSTQVEANQLEVTEFEALQVEEARLDTTDTSENVQDTKEQKINPVDSPKELPIDFGDFTEPSSIEEIDKLAAQAGADFGTSAPKVKASDLNLDTKPDTNNYAVVNETFVNETLEDGLDAFLGDVLDNQSNSLMVQTSFTDESALTNQTGKETLFPMYEQETLFLKETVQLEPGKLPHTDTVSETGIFTQTSFDQEENFESSASEQVSAKQNEIQPADDDLQVIELTEFGTEASAVDEVVESQDKGQESRDDSRQARAEARAKRRAVRRAAAEAAAQEEDIDVFKTAFGKIAKMEANAEIPGSDSSNAASSSSGSNSRQSTTAATIQEDMVKKTVEGLLTASTIEEAKLTTPAVVDESKLTVFEAKHLSIAEKIAAKKAKAQRDSGESESVQSQQMVDKTEFGRGSRKAAEALNNFGEDDYDAIGKSSKVSETQSAKLTYFEMPPVDGLEDDEVLADKKEPVAQKKRKGLFARRNKNQNNAKKQAEKQNRKNVDILDDDTDIGFVGSDAEFSTEFASDNLKITAERQEEFNKALGVSPMRNAWRITAASLVLLGSGFIVLLALPGLKNAQESFVEQSTARETETMLGLQSDHVIFTQVSPANIENMISVIVVKSPEGSKYPVGHVFDTFPNSPLSLDVRGEWELQARYRRILSNTVPFELPILGGEPVQFNFNLQ